MWADGELRQYPATKTFMTRVMGVLFVSAILFHSAVSCVGFNSLRDFIGCATPPEPHLRHNQHPPSWDRGGWLSSRLVGRRYLPAENTRDAGAPERDHDHKVVFVQHIGDGWYLRCLTCQVRCRNQAGFIPQRLQAKYLSILGACLFGAGGDVRLWEQWDQGVLRHRFRSWAMR